MVFKKKKVKQTDNSVQAGTEHISIGQPPMPPPHLQMTQEHQQYNQAQMPYTSPYMPPQAPMIEPNTLTLITEINEVGKAIGGFEAAALVLILKELRQME